MIINHFYLRVKKKTGDIEDTIKKSEIVGNTI